MGETILPACKTLEGCEIEDVAPDPDLNKVVQGYLKLKRNQSGAISPRIVEAILEDAGLLDDYDTLLELDDVWREFVNFRRQQEEDQARAERGSRGYHINGR